MSPHLGVPGFSKQSIWPKKKWSWTSWRQWFLGKILLGIFILLIPDHMNKINVEISQSKSIQCFVRAYCLTKWGTYLILRISIITVYTAIGKCHYHGQIGCNAYKTSYCDKVWIITFGKISAFQINVLEKLFNRPGVAGAVLQTPSTLIN